MEQENSLNLEEQVVNPEVSVNETITEPVEEITIEVVKENQEIPNVDFSILTTEEIVNQTQKLVNDYPLSSIKQIMDSLPILFESKYKEEYNKALATFTSDGDNPEGFKYDNKSKEEFNALYKLYRDKRSAVHRQIEAEREENLKIKQGIIEDIKALIQKEESVNKTFQEFRDLQDHWRNTGMVPQAQLNGLLETYHLHVENFYNYIKINNELRDLDLKRNLDAKLSLCEEAERLIEENDTSDSFKQLQLLHTRWKEIGPAPREQKEAVWERFKVATGKINEKYHSFFETLRQEQEDNLKIKEELCEKAEALATGEYKTISEWNDTTKAIIDLQEEWKHSGTVPQKERNRIYKKFRHSCDIFFDRKREFYKATHTEQDQNLELKITLCEKVEAIKDSTEWKITTDKIISYQKEWKKIGSAPKKFSNKVWTRFRAACDTFFNNKNAFFKDIDAEQDKNLALKEAMIEEIKQFTLSGNNEEDIKNLKTFQSRWIEIGYVPLKAKNTIQEEFRTILNKWFDQLNLNEFDRDLERFKSKLNTFDSGQNKAFKIVNEREKLVAKIRLLESDINTWENNMGFFAKSNRSQGLLEGLNSKIEETKQRLKLLKEKLKSLDSLI